MKIRRLAGRVAPVAAVVPALLSLAAVLVMSSPAPSLAASTLVDSFESSFGYRIDLPAGWRHSTLLSVRIDGNPVHLGHDVYTVRTTDDERNGLGRVGQMGPACQYALVIEVYRNPERLTALQWAGSFRHAGWAKGQSIQQVRLAGREAALLQRGARYAVAYFVPDGDRMFLLGYRTDLGAAPTVANENALRAIVVSFRFAP